MNTLFHQRGVTLIELLIAMVIGLFVIAGVGQIFLSSRASYNLQERMGNLQENGRYGLFFLQRSIRRAGYRPPPIAGTPIMGPSVFTPDPSSLTCGSGSVATCNGAGTASDQITVNYQGSVDCLGNPTAPSSSVTDTFFISTDTTTGLNRLMCRGSGNPAAQPLVDGIENMQVQYGIDTTNDGYADSYVVANSVTDWDKVVSVRVALLASTKSNDSAASGVAGVVFGDTASDAMSYQVLENLSATVATGVRARVFTSTVELRNRTP